MESVPNYIDIGLMAALAFFIIRALVRGFVKEVLGLVGVLVAVVISAMTFEPLGDLLQSVTGVEGAWWHAVAFVLVLVSIFIIFAYIGSMFARLVQHGPFTFIDRLLGAATGLVKGILITYLLINLMLLATPFQVPAMLRNSAVAPHVIKAGRHLVDMVPFDLTRTLQEKAAF
jgi:membrane protein required for colicin V production